jgi:hypothetical protein
MAVLDEVEASSPILIEQGLFSIDITGTFVATLTLQRAPATIAQTDLTSANYSDVKEYTAVGVDTGLEGSRHWYRFEIKTGAYTSGSATVRITQ